MPTPEEIRAAAQRAIENRRGAEEIDESVIGRSEKIYKEQEEMFESAALFYDPEEEAEEEVAPKPKEKSPEELEAEKKRLQNEVVWQGHPTWRGMVGLVGKGLVVWIVLSLILFGLAKAGVVSVTLMVLLSVLVLGGVFVVARLVIKTTVYTITRSKVSERRGIINTVSEQAHLEQITNIQITRNFYERMVGIGKVDIDTASDVANISMAAQSGIKAKNILDWWGVKDPYRIQAMIDELRLEKI